MDWGNVIIYVLCGTIGLIVGWCAGMLLKAILFFAGEGLRRIVSMLTLIAGVAAAVWFLPEHVRPHADSVIADYIQADQPTVSLERTVEKKPVDTEAVARAIELALQDLQDPFFEAVLAREHNRAETVKDRMVSAYRRGGQEALVSELQQAAQDTIKTSFPYYMARGEEDDLLTAVRSIKKVIEVMAANDPETCHLWLYGSLTGKSFDFDKYIIAIGEDRHKTLQAHLASVVRDASDILPEYDEMLAEQRLGEISDQLIGRMGVEKVGLITSGQEPLGVDDAKLACEATADFFQYILEDDLAVDLLRHRYLSSAG
ncbi:MAG: hypothetical protein MRY72_01330 [Aquisalinus sp.]|nr:hypothetical protein [Aquisalinus sp.]